jgi:hypothetical protein
VVYHQYTGTATEARPIENPKSAITKILEQATAHDRDSLDALLPLVYDELRVMARRQLAGEWRQKPT